MTRSVMITGASGGLGAGMARHFARRGYRLALTARDAATLEPLTAELQTQSPQVVTRSLDVTRYEDVPVILRECAAELDGLDIVIANAGVAIAATAGTGDFDTMRRTIDTNLNGAMATADSAIELFREQGQGHLVGVTSVAALRGMRRQGAYSASKAGFSKFLEALRVETLGENIAVTELAPGYIDTDLNRSLPSRPFLVSAEQGTASMVDLIERRVRHRYVPPWPWTLVAQVLKVAPLAVLRRM